MGLYGVYLGDQAEALNLRVRWTRLDGISAGPGSIVSNNMAYQNGRHGIIVGSATSVSGNNSYLNGETGIYANWGSSVTGNNVRGNGGGSGFGLFLQNDVTYSENMITNNSAGGVDGSGVNLGGNFCSGPGVISASCP